MTKREVERPFLTEDELIRIAEALFAYRIETVVRVLGRSIDSLTNCIHISLNFDVNEKLSQNKLNEIAADYMEKIVLEINLISSINTMTW